MRPEVAVFLDAPRLGVKPRSRPRLGSGTRSVWHELAALRGLETAADARAEGLLT
jgi:hypothetical protein